MRARCGAPKRLITLWQRDKRAVSIRWRAAIRSILDGGEHGDEGFDGAARAGRRSGPRAVAGRVALMNTIRQTPGASGARSR